MNEKLSNGLRASLTSFIAMILFSSFLLVSRYAANFPVDGSLFIYLASFVVTVCVLSFVVVYLFSYNLWWVSLSSFLSSILYLNFHYRNIEYILPPPGVDVEKMIISLMITTSFEVVFFTILSFGILHVSRGLISKNIKRKKK